MEASLSRSKQDFALKAVVRGPGVGSGRIDVADFAQIAASIQRAVRQIGTVAKTGSGSAGGFTKAIQAMTRLDVVALQAGSAGLVFDFPTDVPRPFQDLDLGTLALDSFLLGVDELNGDEFAVPPDWDRSVFRALDGVCTSLDQGRVQEIELSTPRRSEATTFNRETRERVKRHRGAQQALEFVSVAGRLMMVDFEPERRRTRIESPDGASVRATFPLDLTNIVRENAMRFVTADGYANVGADGKIRHLSILRLASLQTPAGVDAEPPLRSIQELIDIQGIRPSSTDDLVDHGLWSEEGELEEFLEWVSRERGATAV